MNIGIRADGGKNIGMGHIMRCMALYERFKEQDINCIFISKQDTSVINYFNKNNVAYEILHSDNLKSELQEMKVCIYKYKLDIIITDSYLLDESYLKEVKNMSKYLISIDDNNLYNYPSDMVINYNIYAHQLKYKNQIAKYLLGLKYCILRKEFREQNNYIVKKNVKNILITMGGSDVNNFTTKVINSIKDYKNININVVIGSGFKNILEIKKVSQDYKNINLIIDPQNMKDVMLKNDIAISSAGCTAYELGSIGIPTILTIQAQNQIRIAEEFENTKIAKNLGWYSHIDKDCIINAVDEMIKSYDKRNRISYASKALINKNGIENIIKEIYKGDEE
ncbi:UDP-2,4-diacetamido-2,4,6-trideoxy-beta-L-altropyranose hydrolase [Tepidibacter sp. Z1-5]|uniref:UDP-2,4-diacetamido-2,4, 6-trideoxy-beta-L-altropyranose hydrolase n=1 Tax=Tepidibacter sp. Z1-5 TaxID=3134138 RepID=UPI0030BD3C44